MLDPAGSAALSVSRLWWGMFVFFTLVSILVFMLWCYAIKPRNQFADKQRLAYLNRYLMLGGGVILPGLTIVVLLLFGIPVGKSMLPYNPPGQKAMRINVIGHQWFWEVHYPDSNIRLINKLHLPLNQPIDIAATTDDVIHSFWVPSLNGKIDMIPGYTNKLRLQAFKTGTFRGQCAEFCGLWHARMILKVQVHTSDSFTSWVKSQQLNRATQSIINHAIMAYIQRQDSQ